MAKNTSIVLGEHFDNFIGAQLAHGRFGSTSEVVRAGLRLLEARETKLEALRQALIDGENSGTATEFDVEAFKARKRSEKLDV